MNDPRMQKDWHNEPPPLIRLRCVCRPTILNGDLAPAKPTPLAERAPPGYCRHVWARVGQVRQIGYTLDNLHAGNEARAHVNKYVSGRADHGVDLGFDGYGGTSEDSVARDFGDEDSDLDGGEDPADPRATVVSFVVRRWPVLLLWGSRACTAELARFCSGHGVLGTGVVERDPVVVRLMLVIVVAVGGAVRWPTGMWVVGGVDVYGLCRVVAAEEAAVVVAGNAVGGWEGGLEGKWFVDGRDCRVGGCRRAGGVCVGV